MGDPTGRSVHFDVDGQSMRGELTVPRTPRGIVVFATSTAGARHASLETQLAESLHENRVATLVTDLLSHDESADRASRTDVETLARRLEAQLDWLSEHPGLCELETIVCGIETGAAAAFRVAAVETNSVDGLAVVNGHLDLAEPFCHAVDEPVLIYLDDSHAHRKEGTFEVYSNLITDSRNKHFYYESDGDTLDVVAWWTFRQLSATDTDIIDVKRDIEQQKHES